MITVTIIEQYTCSDGEVFTNREGAERYEAECEQVAPILARIPMSRLPHGTYVTHDPECLKQIKRDLWPLVLKKVNAADSFPTWLKSHADDINPLSIVGRVMDDTGGPIAAAWRRLAVFCFVTGREFDQQYFVKHQSEAVPYIKDAE